MKLSKTYEVSCCQIAPLKIRGARPARLPLLTCPPLAFADLPAAQLWQAGALAQAGRREFFGRRGSYGNNPLCPPYFKGDT